MFQPSCRPWASPRPRRRWFWPRFPAGTDPKSVQIAAGAATSGNHWVRGLGHPRTRHFPELPPASGGRGDGGGTIEDVRRFESSNVPDWDCLATTSGTTGLGFSVVAPDSAYPQTSDFLTPPRSMRPAAPHP
jgi:hypothetical protein